MSTSPKRKNILESIATAPQRTINYIYGAASRLFSPRDDNYPEIGVQPFEGEPADKKHF
ncbi:MAG TPA: hypothetical protein VK184_21050 [Nostocaceae cyanobacterium]|nr:hypothetical protein [Nostocaceae cyanobacterium]